MLESLIWKNVRNNMQNLASYIWWFLVFTVDLVLKIKKSWNFWKIYKLLDFNDTVDAPASTVTGSLFIELSIKMYNWWRCLVQQVQNSTTRGKKGKQPKGKSLRPKEHQKKRKTENLKTSSELRDACHSPLLPPPLPSPHLAYWLFVSFPLSKHHHSPA